jgi:Na+-driven multidrug efflux pump
VNLLEGPVGSTLLRLAGPLVLGFVAVILINVVDTFYIGRLGTLELAAISFTFPVLFLIMSLAIGIGVGVTSVVSRVIGQGDHDRVCRLTTDGLFLANTIVVFVALTGLMTIRPLFTMLGATEEMIPLIRSYMLPWYLGIGFIVIPMVGNSAIRATGDTKTPSMVMMIAGGVNIVLDPLLIFGPGPFPRLELQGAAIATVISYAITFAAAVWILGRREHMLDFSRPRVHDVLNSWRQILHVGIPAAGTQMLIPIGAGILTRMVSVIGPMAISASMTPFVGQNLGAGNCDRVRAALRFAIKTCIAYGLVIWGVLAVLAPVLAGMFNRDPDVVRMIVQYLYIVPISYGLFGVLLSVNANFNAGNQPMKAAFTILVRLFVLAVPLAYLGSQALGVPGLFAGIGAANLLVGVLAILMVRRFIARTEERLAREAQLSPAG